MKKIVSLQSNEGVKTHIKQVDSYKKSLLEALANLLGGYPVMFVVGIIILPLSANWIKEDPLVANITITGVYASINFTRSFLLRRLFAKYGIYDNIVKLGIKLKKKYPVFCLKSRELN